MTIHLIFPGFDRPGRNPASEAGFRAAPGKAMRILDILYIYFLSIIWVKVVFVSAVF